MGFGLAFAGATFAYNVVSGRQREKKISSAQAEQRRIEEKIRQEQAVRERRKLLRTSTILRSQIEAKSLAQTETAGFGTNVLGTQADVAGSLGRGLSDISTSLAQGSALAAAQEGVFEAARPSTLDIFAQQAQPLIFSNIDRLDTFFESAFSSKTGTP